MFTGRHDRFRRCADGPAAAVGELSPPAAAESPLASAVDERLHFWINGPTGTTSWFHSLFAERPSFGSARCDYSPTALPFASFKLKIYRDHQQGPGFPWFPGTRLGFLTEFVPVRIGDGASGFAPDLKELPTSSVTCLMYLIVSQTARFTNRMRAVGERKGESCVSL